ncbi:MAG: site-specific integrase [Mycobacteriaceae bacterium]
MEPYSSRPSRPICFTATRPSTQNPRGCRPSRAKAAELPVIRLHDLRHTWATLALAAGIPAKVVQDRLGHSTIAITLNVYSHVTPQLQTDAAASVAALSFGEDA